MMLRCWGSSDACALEYLPNPRSQTVQTKPSFSRALKPKARSLDTKFTTSRHGGQYSNLWLRIAADGKRSSTMFVW
eukprot:4046776-Prymnesium_polylepis.1